MKFHKTLCKNSHKYRLHILPDFWFEYKNMKKHINRIKTTYPSLITNTEKQTDDECCICLEQEQLMNMICCNQNIHYTCFMKNIMYNTTCPLCRSDIATINKNKQTEKHYFDAEILSLLSNIQLNILKVETVYAKKLIANTRIMKKYCHLNYLAVMKTCKKIKKHLHIDVLQYFTDIMSTHCILQLYNEKDTVSCALS